MPEEPTTGKVIHFLVYGFVVFIGLALLLTYVTTSEIVHITDIPKGLEKYVLIQRFLNNPDCLAYQDENTSRVYPGIVDLEKFTSERLDHCFNTENEKFSGFKLTINGESIQTSKLEGAKIISKHILIFKDNKFEEGEIKIES